MQLSFTVRTIKNYENRLTPARVRVKETTVYVVVWSFHVLWLFLS